MIGVAGTKGDRYTMQGLDVAMKATLEAGVLGFCGVTQSRLELLYDSIGGSEAAPRILQQADQLATEFVSAGIERS
jgi:hypothetical protein